MTIHQKSTPALDSPCVALSASRGPGAGVHYLQGERTKMSRVLLEKCFIAGWDHHEGQIADLQVDQRVLLTREPENEYDSNAIKVIAGSFMIGYVPKVSNGALALLMDEGRLVEAKIAALDLGSKNPWKKCAVTVTLKVEGK